VYFFLPFLRSCVLLLCVQLQLNDLSVNAFHFRILIHRFTQAAVSQPQPRWHPSVPALPTSQQNPPDRG
jgi:hypothetical protein